MLHGTITAVSWCFEMPLGDLDGSLILLLIAL